MSIVLGETVEVIADYDKARKNVKDHPNNETPKEKYLDSVAVMQTRVSHAVTQAKLELKAFEKEYFSTQCELPSSTDSSPIQQQNNQ